MDLNENARVIQNLHGNAQGLHEIAWDCMANPWIGMLMHGEFMDSHGDARGIHGLPWKCTGE